MAKPDTEIPTSSRRNGRATTAGNTEPCRCGHAATPTTLETTSELWQSGQRGSGVEGGANATFRRRQVARNCAAAIRSAGRENTLDCTLECKPGSGVTSQTRRREALERPLRLDRAWAIDVVVMTSNAIESEHLPTVGEHMLKEFDRTIFGPSAVAPCRAFDESHVATAVRQRSQNERI